MDLDLILEPDLSPAEIKELAVAAEGCGIRTLWASNYSSARDAFLSMVPAAQATKRLGIGVLVVSPWEMHPLKIANALLTLNEYAGGRAQLVVSGGGEWVAVIGAPRPRRVRAVRETVEMIHAAASGKTISYKGELYKAWHYKGWSHDKAPLVYAGASKPQMLRMAAEVADGAMMSDMTPHYVRDAIGILRDRLAGLGRPARDFRISNFWAWHVKKDAAASMREARRELILRGWLVRFHIARFMTSEECDFIEAHKQAFTNAYNDRSGDIKGVPAAMVDKLIENFCCAGDFSTMDAHIARLKEFAAAGFTEVALRLHDDPMDAIRTIGERVVPALR